MPEDWIPRLAVAVAAALREYSAWRLRGKPVVAFDVGCFPWHGSVELSLLTADELDTDPALQEPGELAAWHHYNFSAGLSSWDPESELGRQMAEAYQAADNEGSRLATVDTFLRACAEAIARPEVTEALGSLVRDARFQIRVAHPDNGRQFWPPGPADGAA
ncbi:hypothetical protein [Fimbriiglobus ruber]|uniref:hypothetical protein n=1 Tax=Fimbriiglobus ruber TaxID=1908690 RepID=UPI00117AEA62|nr:hypothetical protein [Fimbriiglobus ruber]